MAQHKDHIINKEIEYTDEQLGELLLESFKQMQDGQVGRITTVTLTPAAQARQKSGLSQSEFANLLGISKKTLQGWEQGRREPQGPAKVLIRIADTHPEILREVNKGQQAI